MPEHIPPPRGGAPHHPRATQNVRHALWPPTLVRAVTALVFGAVTIFWQEPTQRGTGWAVGVFLVGTGIAWVFLHWRLTAHDEDQLGPLVSVPRLTGVLYILGGALVAIVAQENWVFVLLTATVLGLCGFLELALGLRFRRGFPLASDWVLGGLVTVAAAMVTVMVESLGVKAELGVVGGAAIVIAVTQFIAALTLRHDALAADRGASPARGASKPVD